MKKITLLFLLITSSVFSQELATTDSGKRVQLNKNGTYSYLENSKIEETILKDSDFIKLDEKAKYKEKPFYIINGDENPTKINFIFSCPLNRYSSLSIEMINSMIATANIKTMFKMKNRRTYIPKKISFFFSDKDSTWLIAVDYVANNDYGGQKDGTSYSSFDEIGTFKNVIII